MKNIKKIMTGIALLCIIGVFAACSSQQKPEDVVKSYMDATIAMDSKKQNEYLQTKASEQELKANEEQLKNMFEGDQETSKKIYDAMQGVIKNAKYKIKDTKIEGDKAAVTLSVQSKDVMTAITTSIQESLGKILSEVQPNTQMTAEAQKEMQKKMADSMIAAIGQAKEKQSDITIDLIKLDNAWKVSDASAMRVAAAILGTDEASLNKLPNTQQPQQNK